MIYKYLSFFSLGIMLLAALACGKESSEEESLAATGRVYIRLSGSTPSTKLDGVVYERDEKPVSHWTFFLFESSTGQLVYRETVNDSSGVERMLPTGSYELFAMGNYPTAGAYGVDVSVIITREQFLALKAGLADNAPGAFVMAGNSSFTVEESAPDEAPQEISVRMKRLVAKLSLESVTRAFASSSLADKPLTIKHIYLTNVYGEARYGSDYTASSLSGERSLWYNGGGWHREGSMAPSAAADLLTCERNLNLTLPQGETLSMGRSLYFYPNPLNPADDSHAENWEGPRCTRLVLETQLDGKTYYYQATLPQNAECTAQVRNTAFSVSCTLTGLGSTDPEQELPGGMELQFRAEPGEGWDEDHSVTEES